MARVCHTFLRLLSWWLWIFSWYASSTVQSAPQIQNEKSNKSKPESAAVQWFFNMPSSNPMLNSCVCFVVVVFGWIEVALSAIHKLPESSRCPPRSRACTRWALCVALCTVWHCVALCDTLHCTLHTLGSACVAIHLFPPLCPPPCILAVLPIRAQMEIAHFYTKLTAPKLTLLLGGTTYMSGKYLGLCCPRGRADFLVVVVDVGDIFSIFRKWCKNHFFQKTNYQAT